MLAVRAVRQWESVMDLVLVAAVAVWVWVTIVAIAIGMCRVAARSEAREGGSVGVIQGTDSALRRAGLPAI